MNRACRKQPCRLRAEGPLAHYLEPYSGHLAECGYSQVAYWKKTFLINEFSRWLAHEGVSASQIASVHVSDFLRERGRHCRIKPGDHFTLSGMTGWLREKGVIEVARASAEMSDIDLTLQEYSSYLREVRGLAPETVKNYSRNVSGFLTDVSRAAGLCLDTLQAGQIADYIRRNAPKGRTFIVVKHVVTALRSFFHFAPYRDDIHTDLDLHRFRSGLLRAMLSSKETGYGNDTQ